MEGQVEWRRQGRYHFWKGVVVGGLLVGLVALAIGVRVGSVMTCQQILGALCQS
jgi:hypothetical protein